MILMYNLQYSDKFQPKNKRIKGGGFIFISILRNVYTDLFSCDNLFDPKKLLNNH